MVASSCNRVLHSSRQLLAYLGSVPVAFEIRYELVFRCPNRVPLVAYGKHHPHGMEQIGKALTKALGLPPVQSTKDTTPTLQTSHRSS